MLYVLPLFRQQLKSALLLIGILAAIAIAIPAHASPPAEAKVVNEYLSITPAFVTNFGGAGKMRYLRIEVALRLNEPGVAAPVVDKHMPLVKHAMIMLMSEQVEEDLMTMEGKEILRQAALEEVRKIYAENAKEIKQPIKDLLFSSFIIQ